MRFPVSRVPAKRSEPVPAEIPVDRATLREARRQMLDPKQALSGRRAIWYAGVPLVFYGARSMARLGRALDDVFYPSFREQEVVAPTFIFANMRSGTTLLHRLMSLDEERFAGFKLYQTMFPSITMTRIFEALARRDPQGTGALSKLVQFIDDRFLSGWEGIHDIRLEQEEEDEALWLYTLLSPTITLLFPEIQRFGRANWFDLLDAGTRSRMLAFYEDAIKRRLYAAGGERTFLNKSVFLSPRVRSMLEQFPDARFIYLVRHPYSAIGSMLRMWHMAWQSHSPEIAQDSEQMRAMAQLAIDAYRYSLDLRRWVPPRQFLVVRFDDLVQDPIDSVERIYKHFGLNMSDRYRRRLFEAQDRIEHFKSRPDHVYCIEQFGLSRETIREQLGDLFEEFGFES